MRDLDNALRVAIEAARGAGELIRRDTWRADGPRGAGHHADVDDEAEALIRARLLHHFPEWSYYGEETGVHRAADERTFWLVDPNDGTASYLRGYRASAVSIALVRDGVPVLGVVYAPCYPDDDGDLIAWAEGCGPMQRNGRPVVTEPLPDALTSRHVVLVSQAADRKPEANLACTAPARYRAMSSIAYRLALVAVGEGEAAVSLAYPGWFDFAGGHALLRARGGEVTDSRGTPVRYPQVGSQSVDLCLGGSLAVCADLGRRDWHMVEREVQPTSALSFPVRLPSPHARVDAALLARAQGVLLGQLAGDSLGSLVEFKDPQRIRTLYPEGGPRDLADGGVWNTLAGQATDDSELALALARSLVATGRFEEATTFAAYRTWYQSHPFDVGSTTHAAFSRAAHTDSGANAHSESNGALMRVSPLGIAAHRDVEAAVRWADLDAGLSHPNPVCRESSQVFVRAVAAGLAGASRQEMYRAALEASTPLTREVLERAALAPPPDFMRQQGWVKTALHNAFHRLLHAETLEQGVIDTVCEGGDTDTNGAIAGALLGAFHGREGVPERWRREVLTCRATRRHGALQPRPSWCWPVDVYEIAERLLCLGG